RNKTDLKDQSLDDLFNNLKIYEAEVKSSSSTSLTTQNIAFVSSQNTDSTNESVSVVTSVSTASTKVSVSALPNVDNLTDAIIYSFFANEEPTKYAFMAFISSSSFSSDNEAASGSKACSKAYTTLQSHYDKFTNDLRKSQFDVLSYKTGLESIEARLVVYQQNENVFEEDIKLIKLDIMLRDNALNLSKLLARQITNKTGLGYDNQVFHSTVFDCDELISSKLDVCMPTSPVHDRHVVPTAVITRSRLVPLTATRPVTTAVLQTKGNLRHALNDKGVIDSGCSRHMTGNISYLSDFKEINGGYVAFGGNLKGGKLDFELPDENHVLLRVPRENNMYNVDLKNIVPSEI
nr:hypothetical protein [Tanacetum cinerariifolium]